MKGLPTASARAAVVADKQYGFSYCSGRSMTGAEIFTTIAQLAVAVTGFSGIVIAFNRQPGRLSDFEAFRILILFTNSLAAMFLSLIPFALHYMNWERYRGLADWKCIGCGIRVRLCNNPGAFESQVSAAAPRTVQFVPPFIFRCRPCR